VAASVESKELPPVPKTTNVIRIDGERHNIPIANEAHVDEAEQLLRDGYSINEIADHMRRSVSWIYSVKTKMLARDAIRAAREDWGQDPWIRRLLALDLERPADFTDVELNLGWAVEATERFLEFEQAFFRIAGNKPYIRKGFHRRWITETLLAIATGGYLQIMAPPRHGKTELLRNFTVWLICRDLDIRILWVGPNETTAGETVTAVREILTENEELRLAVLGPGVLFKSSQWSSLRFTVQGRTVGLTGSTMLAVGRGAKILSKNADLIVCDDIEDFEGTNLPSARKQTRGWFGQDLDSRKEEHSALMVIGSRVHPDDLYGYNIDNADFRIVIDAAHAADCVQDPHDERTHQECMLFQEIRTYRWLMTKKRGAENRAEADRYNMVYLNDPQTETFQIYVKAGVEPSFNRSRILGLEGIPREGRRLIAGLDPSDTGFQASFLWAVTPTGYEVPHNVLDLSGLSLQAVQDRMLKRWMVDIENRRGGGIEAALQQMEAWLDIYGVKYWVVETNMYKGSIRKDPRVVEFCRLNGVHIEDFSTQGANKHDPRHGVAAQKRLFTHDMIDLPYGDNASREKTNTYARQLYAFTDDAVTQAKQKSDVMMAGWFPQKRISKWEKETIVDRAPVRQLASAYPTSYPNLTGFTNQGQAPWRR
jgi:hypothetical protein